MRPKKKPLTGDRAPAAPALPASGPEHADEHPPPPTLPLKLRILLVEDSAPDVELTELALREAGLDLIMVPVDTREKFEAELVQHPPNLILSDYSLPSFDGATALEIAQQYTPNIPFIFLTGVLGEEVAIDMLKKGATDYVLKTHLSRLLPAVTRALRETRERREREHAEEKLRRSHQQLRALTSYLQSVREEERTRIAREVHDELGQALTGLKLDLSWLSGKLNGHAAKTLPVKVKEMIAQIDATIHTVRRIATELRPGILDSLGLLAAIEWQTSDFQERTGIQCDLRLEVKDPIWDQTFTTVCFRIFQETLTNIIRHAKATEVEITLAQDGSEVVLTVRDNGKGISEKEIINARSIGLIGMKERAAQIGGSVFFFGLPDRGTTVTMRVPLSSARSRETT